RRARSGGLALVAPQRRPRPRQGEPPLRARASRLARLERCLAATPTGAASLCVAAGLPPLVHERPPPPPRPRQRPRRSRHLPECDLERGAGGVPLLLDQGRPLAARRSPDLPSLSAGLDLHAPARSGLPPSPPVARPLLGGGRAFPAR